MIDEALKTWASARQSEFIDAINAHGGYRKAARAMGLNKETLRRSMERLMRHAASRGYAPANDMTKVCPDPFIVRGVSTYYDETGAVKGQWVKTKIDDSRLEEMVRSAVEAMSEDVKRAKPVSAPKTENNELANLYTLCDTHIGMKSWAEETGADWDLDIAERVLIGAFNHLITASPVAGVAIINFLGDIMHFDSLDAVTPQHRNLLDADSRYPKVVKVAVRILRSMIDTALTRHSRVVVSFQEGNHDLASSVWLRHLFSLVYENEPRVQVLDDVRPYSVMQHGNVMLAFHHGHLSKNDQLPLLFASMYPKVWGETTRRYCHTGHRHHAEEKEHGGMTVIQHQTIAARDAYAARGGWIADRTMTAITYHAAYGQVGRVTVVPEMLPI